MTALREMEKRALLKQGLSNARAETLLDRRGYPRPPGWHSAFFYPGGNRLRNRVVVFLIALAILAFLWI
jgi:hypothetical protein